MERRAITPIIIRAKLTSDQTLNGGRMAGTGTLRHQTLAAHILKGAAVRAMTIRDAATPAHLLVPMAMGATPAIVLLTTTSDHMAIAMNAQAAMPVVSNVHTGATKIIGHPADVMATMALPISARRDAMITTALLISARRDAMMTTALLISDRRDATITTALLAIVRLSVNMTTARHINARLVVLTTTARLIAVRPDASITTARRAMSTGSQQMGSDETAAIFKSPPLRTALPRMVLLKENNLRAITSDSIRRTSRL